MPRRRATSEMRSSRGLDKDSDAFNKFFLLDTRLVFL